MNTEEFIEIIKTVVEKNSITATVSTLESPPGRQPAETLIALSQWYNNLEKENKENIIQVIKEAVGMTIFSFLCTLDGVRAIENSTEKGRLNLYYEKGEERILLNNPQEEYLHDIFSSQ